MKSQAPDRPSGGDLSSRVRVALSQAGSSPYRAFRQLLRGIIPLEYRRKVVRAVRLRMGRGWRVSAESSAASLAALSSLLERSGEQRCDIVCYPIINWDFRFQRPQQLAARLSASGHRVFYLSQAFLDEGPPYELSQKRKNIYEVTLRGPERNVYTERLDAAACEALAASLDLLRRDLSLGATVSLVDLPFWRPLAEHARREFAWPLIYDCMDHHAGFTTNRPEMVGEEDALIRSADAVLVSSRFLEREVDGRAQRLLLLRNGCDYEHFAAIGARPAAARPVIGYYGAIANWFDSDLVADLAEANPQWDFLLVGSTFSADLSRLGRLKNVQLPGEQPYDDLPRWIEQMDVLILPFKRTPLTEATNPVKAYEILAAGKPLVSAPLPEMVEMADYVRLASNAGEFARQIAAALEEKDPELIQARRAFARANTWEKRVEALEPVISEAFPLVSIIVVTYNNLELNRLCLQSIYANTEWPRFEVIVVDNASSDGTREMLQEAAQKYPRLRVFLNDSNRGFAAANNQGLEAARGHYLVLLNNDTAVPRGWVTALIRHLCVDPTIGLIGPVTNEIGNEARIPVGYASIEEMPAWAAAEMRKHDKETFAIGMLAMYCVALRREVYEKVGPLDERFGIGTFEDDDYARRVREAGYRLVCARDSFVHHAGSASFKRMESEQYFELFERNRRLYEEKWGEVWQPHADEAARSLVPALRQQLGQIVARAKNAPAVIFLPGESWEGDASGRRQRLARLFAREGALVFFDCSSSQRDDFFGFEQTGARLWLYKGPDRVLDALAEPVLWASAFHAPLLARWPGAAVVYDRDANLAARFRKADAQLLSTARLVVCPASERAPDLAGPQAGAVTIPDDPAAQDARLLFDRLQPAAARIWSLEN